MNSNHVINWEQSLQIAAGRADLARELIDVMCQDLPAIRERLADAWVEDDRPLLLHEVHKLHGACCYVGMPLLKKSAYDYEKQLRFQSPLDLLADLHNALISAIDCTMQDYQDHYRNQHAQAS